MKQRRAAKRRTPRLAQSLVAQRRRSIRFDLPPGLAPRSVLVTGGNKGIGAAVTGALVAHGADVVVAARDGRENLTAPPVGSPRFVEVDLGDLDSVAAAADRIESCDVAPFDLVILNAGVAPMELSLSAQGHELAFAVNVLGHYVLFERLRQTGALADDARIVIVTGDIQIVARNCTPDFSSTSARAGGMAYARSKLGTLWMARALAAQHTDLQIVAVHPGVVSSGLGTDGQTRRRRRWERFTHITPQLSAQTVLAASCSPEVRSGAYLHNTLGLIELRPPAPAADRARAEAFLRTVRGLADGWVSPVPGS